MINSKKSDVTINVNLNGNSSQEGFLTSQLTNSDRALTKDEIAQQLEDGKLVNVNDNDGGVIHARLICTPAGSGVYYSDTRNAEGKLEIGDKLDYVS